MGFLRRNIDLLPEGIQRQKRNRRLLYVLVATQFVIIVCITLTIIGVNILGQQVWEESGMLAQDIDALRQSPEVEAATYARELLHYVAAEEIFFEFNAPAEFAPLWLEAIIYADTGHLTSLDYDGTYIVITGIVYDFNEIEAFRLRLIEAEIFGDVGLGGIRSQEAERFWFDLRLAP